MHKPPRISPVLALIGPLLAAACSPAPERVPADLVLRNVTLIDGTGAEARANVDVFVRDGLIAAVLPNGSVEIPADADVVEGEGSFVMPGLADMHVHFSLGLPAPRRPGETDEVLGRLLYYGVTSVLNLGASEGSTEAIRALWARQAAGEVLGPTVYGTGGHLTLPGTHPVWTIFPPPMRRAADSIVAATPEDLPADLYPLGLGISLVRTPTAARAAVRERAAGGMHAIKITVESGPSEFGDDHPLMSADLIRAIVDEAAAHDLRVFAHVSSPNELDSVMAGGAAGIVHTVSERPLPGATLASALAERQLWTVATLSLFDAFIRYAEDPGRMDDPFLRETVTEEEIELFARTGRLDMGEDADSMPAWRAETDATMRDVAALHRAGVPIVLGTDVGNPMVFPGYSAHEELANLVKGGLTPMEAIQAGTLQAARMIGKEAEFGSIEVGKRADLVVLGANPLEDIRNSRAIRTVIARGRIVDRAALLPAR
ncbi:MAG: amidohydrolase family protein [Gemmatimonadota bacterium]